MSDSSRVTRRRFVKGSVGALAFPYYVRSEVLAAPGRPGANDRIGIGGIGIGRQGSHLMGQLPKDARVVAIADANLPRAREMAKRWSAEAYQDYRKLLERKDIDAIVTATPDHWRALVCIAACQGGKDIYAEKPMSLTIREGRLMVQAVRKYGRVFQTGSQQRSMAANRLGCELIRNGRIGKVHTVISRNFPSPWENQLPAEPVPDGLDWDLWCGPTQPVPYNKDLYAPRANPGWISFRRYSGGEVTGWGSHGLDQVQWALGTEQTGPVEIWTEGQTFTPPVYAKSESRNRGNRICAEPVVQMRYANGVTLRFGNGPGGGAIFLGDKGKLTIDRNQVRSDPKDIVTDPIKSSDVRLYQSDNHMRNWFSCMRSRKRPIADVEIGHRSATLCHLANIARWTGRKLRWDPEKERFIGDEEANRHLDRHRRKPYDLPQKI